VKRELIRVKRDLDDYIAKFGKYDKYGNAAKKQKTDLSKSKDDEDKSNDKLEDQNQSKSEDGGKNNLTLNDSDDELILNAELNLSKNTQESQETQETQ